MSVGQIRKIPTKYEQKEEKKNIVFYILYFIFNIATKLLQNLKFEWQNPPNIL